MDIMPPKKKKDKSVKYEGRHGFYLIEGGRARFVTPGAILKVENPDRINHRGKKPFKPV
jgi:hypothetical protein